jgi:hypothetical protein
MTIAEGQAIRDQKDVEQQIYKTVINISVEVKVASLRMRQRAGDVAHAARPVIMRALVKSMWRHLMKRIAVVIDFL